MIPYGKIKKMYFTACGVLFALLAVLIMMKNGWTLPPRALISLLVGWLVICAVLIGVIYMLVSKKIASEKERERSQEQSVGDRRDNNASEA